MYEDGRVQYSEADNSGHGTVNLKKTKTVGEIEKSCGKEEGRVTLVGLTVAGGRMREADWVGHGSRMGPSLQAQRRKIINKNVENYV